MAFEITMLIHNKDDIEFVTEFPCFLGHSVITYVKTKGALYTSNNISCSGTILYIIEPKTFSFFLTD